MKEFPVIQCTSPVQALAAGGGLLWAAGAGGIARWNGSQWAPSAGGLALSSVTALCFAGGWLYAGGPEGIFRSADRGASWKACDVPVEAAGITALAASPNFEREQHLLAATWAGGVLRSENTGRSWKAANFGLQSFEVNALLWLKDGTAFATTDTGVYRSPNGGRAWRQAEGTEEITITALAAGPGGVFYAGAEDGLMFRSINRGAVWEPMERAQNGSEAETLPVDSLAVDGAGNLYLSSLGSGLYFSRDGGAHFERLAADPAFSFMQDERGLYAGLWNGVALLADEQMTHLPTPSLHDLRSLLPVNGRIYVSGLTAGVFTWDEGQGDWAELNTPGDVITALTASPEKVLILSGSDGIFRSADEGATWEHVYTGEGPALARFTFRQDGTGWAGSADGSLLLETRDSGRTWAQIPAPFGVLPLAVLQAAGDFLVAATYDTRRQTAQLWVSTDEAKRWTRGAEAKTNWPVITVCDVPPIITFGGMAFILQPDGRWERREVGPQGSGIYRIVSGLSPAGGQAAGATPDVFALTTHGLLRSTDFAQTWQPETETPPLGEVLDIVIAEGVLYFLLSGGRVWAQEV